MVQCLNQLLGKPMPCLVEPDANRARYELVASTLERAICQDIARSPSIRLVFRFSHPLDFDVRTVRDSV